MDVGEVKEGMRGRETYDIVPSAQHTPVARNRHTSHTNIILRNQLMTALILAQVPNPHIASAIATNQLSLIGMNNDIVDGHAVHVVPLHTASPCIPYLHRAVFRRRNHPFSLAVERDARDVRRMAFEGELCVRIRRLYVVKLDRVVAGGGEEALVGRYAESVYLGVWVGDRAAADAGEGFPEAVVGKVQLGSGDFGVRVVETDGMI
jgi:hypothetical protein